MFLVNSRQSPFTAPPWCSESKLLHTKEDPFFRRYGANLPSSLTRFLSRALEYSSLPPVSVYGTVSNAIRLEAFLGSIASVNPLRPKAPRPITPQSICPADFPTGPPTRLDHLNHKVADLASCVPPSLKHDVTGTGILNPFPIAYAFRPQLRGRKA